MKECIIFGAGYNGERLLKSIVNTGYDVRMFLDNDDAKVGKTICGIKVDSPNHFSVDQLKDCHILISMYDQALVESVKQQLEGLGLKEGKHFSEGVGFIMEDAPIPGRVSGYMYIGEQFDSIKTFDSSSRLVVLNKEKRILRVISKEDEDRYERVLLRCIEGALFEKGVVATSVAQNEWNLPYEFILEHQYISPITYDFEWPPLMFKDYVVFMCGLVIELTRNGLCLCDGHALNATFSDGRFVFIDFGAIDEGRMQRWTLLEFVNTHLVPLILIMKGKLDKGYLYLKNPGLVYSVRDIYGYLNVDERNEIDQIYDLILQANKEEDIVSLMMKMIDYIGLHWELSQNTTWSGYQNDEWKWSNNENLWSTKMRNVVDYIEEVKPETILDLAGNMGWYGAYYRDKCKYAVIVDMDHACVNNLWSRVVRDGIKNVFPVYMSFCAPTLDYYRDEMISGSATIQPWRDSAVKRFKANLTLALAVVHHLVFSQQLTFEEIIAQLSAFTTRFLIVEFIEKEDQYIQDFIKVGFDWYTKEYFEKVLEGHFKILQMNPSTPEDTRTLYLCERKEF